MQNFGLFLFNIGNSLVKLGSKLYEVFTIEVDIKFITKILNFFGASVDLPEYISLSYILTGASAIVLITLIIYKLVT